MENHPASSMATRVSTPSGRVVGVPEGSRLVFGRGPDADLTIAAGGGPSRRGGVVSAGAGGGGVAHIRQTPALDTRGGGEPRRPPPAGGYGRAHRGLVPRGGHRPRRLGRDAGRRPAVVGDGRGAWRLGPRRRRRHPGPAGR